VARDDLTRANSRLFAVELVANEFFGPPLGGLLAAAGLAVALGVPAAAYLVGAGCLALIAGSFRAAGRAGGIDPAAGRHRRGRPLRLAHPVLRPLAIMLGVQNMAFSAAFSVFVLFAVAPGPMGLSKAGYGILTATIGVGSLLGSWLAAPTERRLGRVRTLVLSVVVNAAGLAVPVITALPVPIGVSWLATGAAIVSGTWSRSRSASGSRRPAAGADERQLPAGRVGHHAARGAARRHPGRGPGAAWRLPGRRRGHPGHPRRVPFCHRGRHRQGRGGRGGHRVG
jgi:hypothetical protein